jgi:hypothetical protein
MWGCAIILVAVLVVILGVKRLPGDSWLILSVLDLEDEEEEADDG